MESFASWAFVYPALASYCIGSQFALLCCQPNITLNSTAEAYCTACSSVDSHDCGGLVQEDFSTFRCLSSKTEYTAISCLRKLICVGSYTNFYAVVAPLKSPVSATSPSRYAPSSYSMLDRDYISLFYFELGMRPAEVLQAAQEISQLPSDYKWEASCEESIHVPPTDGLPTMSEDEIEAEFGPSSERFSSPSDSSSDVSSAAPANSSAEDTKNLDGCALDTMKNLFLVKLAESPIRTDPPKESREESEFFRSRGCPALSLLLSLTCPPTIDDRACSLSKFTICLELCAQRYCGLLLSSSANDVKRPDVHAASAGTSWLAQHKGMVYLGICLGFALIVLFAGLLFVCCFSRSAA